MDNTFHLKTNSINQHKNIKINTIFIFIILLWFGGWNSFFSVSFRSYISLLFTLIGFLYFLTFIKQKNDSHLKFTIIIICLLCPLIQAFQALNVFGQPLYMGIASLREIWTLFIAFWLYRLISPERLLDFISRYQMILIICDAIALYLLGIDNTFISTYYATNEDVVTTGTVESNELRGLRLTFGQTYLIICAAYWSIKVYLNDPQKKKYQLYIVILILNYLFVHKGRSAFVGAIIVMILPYLTHITYKNIFRIVIGAIVLFSIFIFIPAIHDKFLVVYDLFGENRTEGTGDFSGVARLNEILLALPLILQHPILGVGNLSYHFNNGFIGFFYDHFYIGDIGIIGLLLIGGINWYFWYIYFFVTIKKSIPNKHKIIYLTVSYLCIFAIFSPFIGGNALWETPRLALILLTISLYYSHDKYLYR